MDQIKIGEFISSLRKEKKMSQKDLADKLNVSVSAVSKWERGKCLPDVSLFNDLCDILSITINELLKGEKKVESKESNKIVTQYLKYQDTQNKKKRIYQGFISILIIIILILFCYFISSYKTIDIYVLYAKSDNFKYENGMLIKSKENNALVEGNISFTNDKLTEENILYTSFYIKNNNDYYLLTGGNNFGGYHVEQNGYYDILDEATKDNLTLWIIYLDENNEIQYEELEIQSMKIPVNDKLIKLKSIPLMFSNSKPDNPMEIVEEHKEYYFKELFIQELNLHHDFNYTEMDKYNHEDWFTEVEKEIDNDTFLSYNYKTDTWTLNINNPDNNHSYKYDNKDKIINGTYNNINIKKETNKDIICSIDNQEILCPKEIEKEINILIMNCEKYNKFYPIKKEE